MEFHIVSECCPVGCGTEVVLLRAVHSGVVFAYCDLCGCIWNGARDAQCDTGLNYVTAPLEIAPEGVDVPRLTEISETPWANAIIRSVTSRVWEEHVDDLNRFIRAAAS